MAEKSGGFKEWIIPFLFVLCAGWAIWHAPAYLIDFWQYEEGSNLSNHINELHHRKDVAPNLPGLFGGVADILDWAALILMPIIFYFGTRNLVLAQMEFAHFSRVDRIAMFIEVFLRYAIEAPTLWANELTLWIGGFVFLLSGIYAMQQRSHIRIFILYDVLPRWMQHVCDTIWVALLWFFMICMVFGSFKQVFVNKFYKWQTFGTAFDPPIPATIQPMILIVIMLISVQALLKA